MPRSDDSPSSRRQYEPPDRPLAKVAVVVMAVVAIVCCVLGIIGHGATWRSVLPGAMLSAVGISYIVIAVFEVEWLERMVGLAGWPPAFFGRRELLTESDLFGERGARRIYFVLGLLLQVGGCLLSLRVFRF